MTETAASSRVTEDMGAGSEPDLALQAKAQQVAAYLSYVLEDVRKFSPTGAFLLEMSIIAFNEDMKLSQWSLQDFTGELS
jgi:hypothetical protein